MNKSEMIEQLKVMLMRKQAINDGLSCQGKKILHDEITALTMAIDMNISKSPDLKNEADRMENVRQNIKKIEIELDLMKKYANSQYWMYDYVRNHAYIMCQLLEEIADDMEEAEKIEDAAEYGSDLPDVPESRGDGK